MNALELISKDGKNIELYINGEKQEQIFDLTIKANVDAPIMIEINRYCMKPENPLIKRR
jgi:hypothetical protein